ncbi:MAG: glycoside hydrolase family protein [Gaiellaceae bacterium MAG52_C11]|nr:glycoside hydrolase family protein [Candidatus Gaiellasilicea maunaloa]
MRRSAALVAASLVLVATVAVPSASGSRFLQRGIFDDAQIHYGNPDTVFPVLRTLRTQLIRINLVWGGVNGVAKRRPTNGANPTDPAYDWSASDRTVNYAAQYGIRVVFSIVGTPPWANAAAGVNVVPRNLLDLQRFAAAAAKRYNGRFPGADGRLLPAVRSWLAWNEPNNPAFLRPQYRRVAGGYVAQSPIDYARICNAIVKGVTVTTVGASKVACGLTAPRGNNNPSSGRPALAPIAFLRGMKKAGATGFDAYAHHPYYGGPSETPSTPPPIPTRGQAPTAVTLGNIDTLIREVTKLYGNKRIWITEYGYQTNPPDRIFGVTPARQAQYLTQAFAIAARHPRIDMMLWFLLRDETRVRLEEGWQSGLLTASGTRKPSFAAFQRLSG